MRWRSKTNYYGNIFLSSNKKWVFRPNLRVLLGGTAKNTGGLLRMPPRVFLRAFRNNLPFLASPSLIFGAANQLSPEGQKQGCLSELGP